MATALITGTTSGIGFGFTQTLAQRGFDLVLVSRNEDRMQAQAAELRERHGIACEVLPADLSVREDVDRVSARLADPARPISVLVNNAGFGNREDFVHSSITDEQAMLDVLVVAVMRLTHAALPGMLNRRCGVVLNVSSVASFMTSGTYAAAKAWVTVFSEGLADEVKDSGVRVTAVCPGFVRTEFHERSKISFDGIPNAMWLDVQSVVDEALRDTSRGKRISVAGAQYKALAFVAKHGPRSLVYAVSHQRRRAR